MRDCFRYILICIIRRHLWWYNFAQLHLSTMYKFFSKFLRPSQTSCPDWILYRKISSRVKRHASSDLPQPIKVTPNDSAIYFLREIGTQSSRPFLDDALCVTTTLGRFFGRNSSIFRTNQIGRRQITRRRCPQRPQTLSGRTSQKDKTTTRPHRRDFPQRRHSCERGIYSTMIDAYHTDTLTREYVPWRISPD